MWRRIRVIEVVLIVAGLAVILSGVQLLLGDSPYRWCGVPGVIFGLALVTQACFWVSDPERVLRARELRMAERHSTDTPAPRPLPGGPWEAVIRARDYLPEKRPAGWSVPISPLGSGVWLFTAGEEEVTVTPDERGTATVIDVRILPPRGETRPVSDSRCAEILGHFVHIGEWTEARVAETGPNMRPSARAWLGLPARLLRERQGETPAMAPVPRATLPSEQQKLLRHHLPEKLPAGWSVPVAATNKVVWMIEVDHLLVQVGFVEARGTLKLMVFLSTPPGDEVTETYAMMVLKHFRHVRDFAPEESADDAPCERMYLGTITDVDPVVKAKLGRARTMPN